MSSHELLATPGSLATFKQDLALHTATPKIEAFFRYYENTVDERAYGVESCGSWVEWRGRGFCAVQDLRRDMELTLEGRAATLYVELRERANDSYTRPKILSFDHVSASVTPASTAIFYFEPQSSASSALLNYLNQHAASDPHFQFIVRYRPPIGRTGDGARYHSLSGYGAEMVLKKMDYLAVDDREYSTCL
jgi:UDP-glucose:glycoprotein glucosyltransferase